MKNWTGGTAANSEIYGDETDKTWSSVGNMPRNFWREAPAPFSVDTEIQRECDLHQLRAMLTKAQEQTGALTALLDHVATILCGDPVDEFCDVNDVLVAITTLLRDHGFNVPYRT